MNDRKHAPGVSRRDFIQAAARGAAGMAVVMFWGDLTLVSANTVSGGPARGREGYAYDPTQHRWIYLVDVAKCIGCGSCVRACERENNVPRHFFRTWVERYQVSRTGRTWIDSPDGARDGFAPLVTGAEITKAFFVPKLCNHCTNTPCVQLCPVGASFVSPDGVVLVDEQRCIGCSYCVQACPYGSRFIHPETHTASKCTLCYHRLAKGMTTACVQNCPTDARRIGDARALGDEVAELIATTEVRVLKPELHTQPNCHYANLGGEAR
ncbi:MAG: 4Fe-4S dicluster domain-containing protein [Krumholzibacteria bacterium]|nr:4Fe-4S dicluster domain-containing protein [Candidatus Krumholzibacteria bacterium]